MSSPDFNNRDKRQVAIEEIADKAFFFSIFRAEELRKVLLVPSYRFALRGEILTKTLPHI